MLPLLSTVYYGTAAISLYRVLAASQWMMHKSMYLPFSLHETPGLYSGALIWDFRYGQDFTPSLDLDIPRPSLAHILIQLRQRFATERKDHIYGMLGIYKTFIDAVLPPELEPDYARPLGQIYADTTRLCIQQTGSLAVLASVFHNHTDSPSASFPDQDLPTWVPTYHQTWTSEQDPADLNNNFCAHGSTDAEISSGLGTGTILTVSGHIVSTVRCLSAICSFIGLPPHALRAFIAVARDMFTCAQDETEHQLAETMIGGSDWQQLRPSRSDCIGAFDALESFLKHDRWPPDPDDLTPYTDLHTRTATSYLQALDHACANRRLFTTDDGRCGLGPRSMIVTDVVAVLAGCPWPVILRPMHVVNHFTFCGVAYVYGIMDGEVVRDLESQGRSLAKLRLH